MRARDNIWKCIHYTQLMINLFLKKMLKFSLSHLILYNYYFIIVVFFHKLISYRVSEEIIKTNYRTLQFVYIHSLIEVSKLELSKLCMIRTFFHARHLLTLTLIAFLNIQMFSIMEQCLSYYLPFLPEL